MPRPGQHPAGRLAGPGAFGSRIGRRAACSRRSSPGVAPRRRRRRGSEPPASRDQAPWPEPRHDPAGERRRPPGAPRAAARTARRPLRASSIAPRAASPRALRARGIAPGEHVALMMPNVPEFTIAYFGILYAGCTVVPLNVLLSAPEVTYHLAGLRGAAPDRAPALRRRRRATGAAGAGVPVVWAERRRRRRALAALAAAAAARERSTRRAPDDTAVILYTSGTTGQAEGRRAHALESLLNCAVVVPQLAPVGADDVALGVAAALPLLRPDLHPERDASRRAAPSRCCRASTPEEALEIIASATRDALRRRAHHVLRAAPPPAGRALRSLERCATACRAARRCRSR